MAGVPVAEVGEPGGRLGEPDAGPHALTLADAATTSATALSRPISRTRFTSCSPGRSSTQRRRRSTHGRSPDRKQWRSRQAGANWRRAPSALR